MMAESWMARARGLTVWAARNEHRNRTRRENLKGFMGLVGDDKGRILYGHEAMGNRSLAREQILRLREPFRKRNGPLRSGQIFGRLTAGRVLRLRRLPGWAAPRPASWTRASRCSGRRPSRGRPTDDALLPVRPGLAASGEACSLAST